MVAHRINSLFAVHSAANGNFLYAPASKWAEPGDGERQGGSEEATKHQTMQTWGRTVRSDGIAGCWLLLLLLHSSWALGFVSCSCLILSLLPAAFSIDSPVPFLAEWMQRFRVRLHTDKTGYLPSSLLLVVLNSCEKQYIKGWLTGRYRPDCFRSLLCSLGVWTATATAKPLILNNQDEKLRVHLILAAGLIGRCALSWQCRP